MILMKNISSTIPSQFSVADVFDQAIFSKEWNDFIQGKISIEEIIGMVPNWDLAVEAKVFNGKNENCLF